MTNTDWSTTERLAAMAMQGLCSAPHSEGDTPEQLAERAFQIAEAMQVEAQRRVEDEPAPLFAGEED